MQMTTKEKEYEVELQNMEWNQLMRIRTLINFAIERKIYLEELGV